MTMAGKSYEDMQKEMADKQAMPIKSTKKMPMSDEDMPMKPEDMPVKPRRK